MNYWLFQGNPEYFKFDLAIKHNVLDSWGVTHHANDIEIGDKVIIWLTGKNRGIGGIAEVLKKPTADFHPKDDYCWTEKGRKKNITDNAKQKVYVEIKILTPGEYFTTPISFFETAKMIKLPVGRGYQNTNYRINESHFNTALKLF